MRGCVGEDEAERDGDFFHCVFSDFLFSRGMTRI
jgi:hypothetical protein